MRLYPRDYRHTPKFLMQRLNRAAAELNVILIVVALGLGALDLLYAAHKVAQSLPTPTPASRASDVSGRN
jgi:hypothetical protein